MELWRRLPAAGSQDLRRWNLLQNTLWRWPPPVAVLRHLKAEGAGSAAEAERSYGRVWVAALNTVFHGRRVAPGGPETADPSSVSPSRATRVTFTSRWRWICCITISSRKVVYVWEGPYLFPFDGPTQIPISKTIAAAVKSKRRRDARKGGFWSEISRPATGHRRAPEAWPMALPLDGGRRHNSGRWRRSTKPVRLAYTVSAAS